MTDDERTNARTVERVSVEHEREVEEVVIPLSRRTEATRRAHIITSGSRTRRGNDHQSTIARAAQVEDAEALEMTWHVRTWALPH